MSLKQEYLELRKFLTVTALVALSISAPAFADEVQTASSAAENAAVQIKRGEPIFDVAGKRIGKVYQVTPAGDAQFIQDLRLLTISAATLSRTDGKLTTSLKRKEIK